MARFPHENELQRMALAVLACGALVACGASSAARPSSDASPAKRFVASLLKNGSAKIGHDAKSCLAATTKGPVTVAAELAEIFGRYIDDGSAFTIAASCEAGESPTRQFCRVSFDHRAGDEEASSGFMFLGNPADGSVDTRTLECFQTP